ncbi:MAG: flagellar assembly protein FliW [Spirochaetales bacterium]
MENILKNTDTPICFAQGLYGFENFTKFMLADSEYAPLMWLQSQEEKALAFLTVDPFLFFPQYEIDVDDETVEELDIANPEDVYVLAIVTVSKTTPVAITANLQGPIVINRKNNKARQIVLADRKWRTKHDLFEQKPNNPSSAC